MNTTPAKIIVGAAIGILLTITIIYMPAKPKEDIGTRYARECISIWRVALEHNPDILSDMKYLSVKKGVLIADCILNRSGANGGEAK